MSTYFPKAGEIVRKWYVVDASGQTLGRLASQVARILMGKENPQYTTFLDTGDHVIVINAEKVKTTGMKSEQKVYQHYTGYPGGIAYRGVPQAVRAQAGSDYRGCGPAHAAQVETGAADDQQAECVSWREASARGAEAASEGARSKGVEFGCTREILHRLAPVQDDVSQDLFERFARERFG